MCSVIILRRPGHAWPLIIAANRDEMADRPWRAPARHWADRSDVIAGLDVLAGGTWLGMNDAGLVAGVLNRVNTLGPAPGHRSRGELPLEALDHADAATAAEALANLNPHAYRPCNIFIVDRHRGFWLRIVRGDGTNADDDRVDVLEVPDDLSMLTAYDLNDRASPRIGRFLPRFEAADVPDPDTDSWQAWQNLLGDTSHDEGSGPGGAMTVITPTGFGTVSSSLIALGRGDGRLPRRQWLFASGRPDQTSFTPCML